MRPPARTAFALALAGSTLSGACSCGAVVDDAGPLAMRVAEPQPKPVGPFLKGQLHAHTSGSMDSDMPPHEVVRWYTLRDYDFLVITDHNRITYIAGTPTMLVFPGIELTINLSTCVPPPAPDHQCLLHMNALITERPLDSEPWVPRRGTLDRAELYGQELEQARKLGGLAQLNHPNFHHAVSADTLAALAARGLLLVEIANQASDSLNDGDRSQPSTEALWDEVLTRGARVFGTATDDAHAYFRTPVEAKRHPLAHTGDRGFVMVRAERTARAIRAALAQGDFYATTGLYFERVELSPTRITVEASSDDVTFEAIGEDGRVLVAERTRTFTFDPDELDSAYVRVRAEDSDGRRAWTQPVFFDMR